VTKRVAVYARVSTARQAENDISIPDQLAQARRFCDGRGWVVAKEFVDAGASARDDKRPELQHMMDVACTDPSPFDVVLVHSQSRFFRDTAGYVFYKRRLEKHAVSLVSMTQDFGAGPAADFAETIIAAADTLHSAENAKHVSRTMLENARQGFWNGSNAPFGYGTVEAEKRGQKIKKRLEVDEREAATVRQIFKLFLEGDGESGSLGVKGIASWLNCNGFRNKSGNQFFTSCVHRILTRETYAGLHYWNRTDSRSRKVKPKDEWVAVPMPAIVTQAEFDQVQDLLKSRRPSVTAPRITTSDVLLTGLAHCENCGGALMLGTGKSGRYRYYSCSSSRLKGKTACPMPTSIPEAELDALVLEALTDHLMTPERLTVLLREALRHRREMAAQTTGKRQQIKAGLKNAEAQIERLLSAVATGALPDMSLLRAKIDALNAQRDECNRHLVLLDQPLPELRQVLSNQQASSVAATLKRRLLEAPKATQRRYVRGLVSNIVVNRELAVITGPHAAIASYASNPDRLPTVPGLVREWRPRPDSNQHSSRNRILRP
jgi:site-specific DNA recombinase